MDRRRVAVLFFVIALAVAMLVGDLISSLGINDWFAVHTVATNLAVSVVILLATYGLLDWFLNVQEEKKCRAAAYFPACDLCEALISYEQSLYSVNRKLLADPVDMEGLLDACEDLLEIATAFEETVRLSSTAMTQTPGLADIDAGFIELQRASIPDRSFQMAWRREIEIARKQLSEDAKSVASDADSEAAFVAAIDSDSLIWECFRVCYRNYLLVAGRYESTRVQVQPALELKLRDGFRIREKTPPSFRHPLLGVPKEVARDLGELRRPSTSVDVAGTQDLELEAVLSVAVGLSSVLKSVQNAHQELQRLRRRKAGYLPVVPRATLDGTPDFDQWCVAVWTVAFAEGPSEIEVTARELEMASWPFGVDPGTNS